MPSKGIIMIAGNRWELHTLTARNNKKFLKLLGEKRENITLRGFCDCLSRQIHIQPGQDKQSRENTLLHEGLHALLWEIGCVHGLSHASGDEKTVCTLTSEILSYCKQTALMPA